MAPAWVPRNSPPGIYEQWRVTGRHIDPRWKEFAPPYDFVWSPLSTGHLCRTNEDAQLAAREFAARAAANGSLADVALSHRSVTVTGWTTADTFAGREETVDLGDGLVEVRRWGNSGAPVQVYEAPVRVQRYTEDGDLAGPVETASGTVRVDLRPTVEPEEPTAPTV